jgi:hypothetical protein
MQLKATGSVVLILLSNLNNQLFNSHEIWMVWERNESVYFEMKYSNEAFV